MKTIRFIVGSLTFRRILLLTFGFMVIIGIADLLFDNIWGSDCMIRANNLNNVYQVPKEYDNTPKINLKLIRNNLLCIECNKKFKMAGHNKAYNYYDSIKITKPDTSFSYTNKIFINFENSKTNDSIYFVISKSDKPNIYWNQIFYSSVKIEKINSFSSTPEIFRIDNSKLVSERLLSNNDSLIKEVINYFNSNKDNLGLAECGTNCKILRTISARNNLPCKLIILQGGDASIAGYDNEVGYPLHAVCEVYSSRFKKWFVLDPTYGAIFRQDSIPLNAVEISNKVFFMREQDISFDSILTTWQYPINKDYFRYYENVHFNSGFIPNFVLEKLLKYFYYKLNYNFLLYSNQLISRRDAREYLLVKSFTYLTITIVYVNVIFIILSVRLLRLKRREI